MPSIFELVKAEHIAQRVGDYVQADEPHEVKVRRMDEADGRLCIVCREGSATDYEPGEEDDWRMVAEIPEGFDAFYCGSIGTLSSPSYEGWWVGPTAVIAELKALFNAVETAKTALCNRLESKPTPRPELN